MNALMTVLKRVKMYIAILVVGYLLICAVMYFMQRSLLYFPTQNVETSEAKALYYEINGQRIKVWQLNSGKDKAILYFGGNAENVANNIDSYNRFFPDHTIYLVNYRGYSGSSGKPTEQGLFDDALAIYDQIEQQHKNIAVFGRSLGSGVAVYLAVNKNIDKLVLITPYDSVRAVAKTQYFWLPVNLLLLDHFDSHSRAANVSVPTLVLRAQQDLIIPEKHTLNLIKRINSSLLKSAMIEGTTHNSIETKLDYFEHILTFLHD